jgi:hypothetical protein
VEWIDARTATSGLAPGLVQLLLLIIVVAIFAKLVLRPKKRGGDPIVNGAVATLGIVMIDSAFVAAPLPFLIEAGEKLQFSQGDKKMLSDFWRTSDETCIT